MLTERSTTVAAAVKLHRHVGRRRAGLFLIEGSNLFEAAAARGLIREVFVTEEAAQRYSAVLATLSTSIHYVTDRAAKALSETVTPSGLVGVCETPVGRLSDVLSGTPSLIAIAVGIGEPGNVGTMIRIADAMGAAAVVLAGHSVDPYNGKCLRASAGSIFSVPVLVESHAVAAIEAVRNAGLTVLATTLDGDARLDEAGELLTRRTAWLFGPESQGLPPDIAARADHRLRIPMAGGAESLNVASAAAICLYESSRALHLAHR